MEQLLSNLPMVVAILPFLLALNIMLTGIWKGLELIKDKTKTQADNKAAALLGKVCTMLQKLLDMVGYNPKH
jgi:hypothetical protein